MPRDANGDYSLPLPDVVTDTVITASWANTTLGDLALAMTDSLDRLGRGGMAAPFQFADGTEAAPGMGYTNEPSTGMYRAGVGDMRVSVLGQDLFRWNNGTAQLWNSTTLAWDAVLTTVSSGTVPDGTLENQVLMWQTVADQWVPTLIVAGVVNYNPGTNVYVTDPFVQGAMDQVDGELQNLNGALGTHASDALIHFQDVPNDGQVYNRKDQAWVPSVAGISEHGDLGGLGADDHLQYHNDARGDARYLQLADTAADSTLWAGKALVITATPGVDPDTIYLVPE